MVVYCKAILFDMDGTRVDSTDCVEAIWRSWGQRHGIDLGVILAASHGRRTADSLREFASHLDVEREAALLDAEELNYTEGIKAVPGALTLLGSLPMDSWAVVTSASAALAKLRMTCAGLQIPKVLVSADDVAQGKPNPAGYLKAASMLGFMPAECLVIEDTAAGVLAGRAAGMQLLALTTTYPTETLLNAPSVRVFRYVRATVSPLGLEIRTEE